MPDSTRASDLILAQRDQQAMHALLNLTRRMAGLLVRALDDQSALHQQSHRLDGVRWAAEYRRFIAKRVRTLEAVVDLLEGVL